MKKLFGLLASVLVVLFCVGVSHATLWDRGGGLIYDDDLDITWLQDANYAGASMSWWDAMDWVSNLVCNGYDDWRLPTTTGFTIGFVNDGEMGHLYYAELGNPTYGPLINLGNFYNVQPDFYWTSEGAGWNPQNLKWVFGFGNGYQNAPVPEGPYYAWAVRDGDVASVPEPASLLLLGTGLVGVVALKRKSNNNSYRNLVK